jgi:hypothetical protein
MCECIRALPSQLLVASRVPSGLNATARTQRPAAGESISRSIIKRIAGEGRKFGVGFAIISQRPSKLDPDVTSQCNTLITMRIKNPDDQRFIAKSTEQLSQADLDELADQFPRIAFQEFLMDVIETIGNLVE